METQHRIIDIENPEYSPEFNGIETLWHLAKRQFRRRLTEERLKVPMAYSTFDIVESILNQFPEKHIINCTAHGWRALFNDSRSVIRVTQFQNTNINY
jgi:hypothetical protein